MLMKPNDWVKSVAAADRQSYAFYLLLANRFFTTKAGL